MSEFAVGDNVQVINPDIKVCDEKLSQMAVFTLKALNFKGKITQIQDDLMFVGFKYNKVWITQVYKADELRKV